MESLSTESDLNRDRYGALEANALEQIDEEFLHALLHFLPALEIILAEYNEALRNNNYKKLWSDPPTTDNEIIRARRFVKTLEKRVHAIRQLYAEYEAKIAPSGDHDESFARILEQTAKDILKQDPVPIHLITLFIKNPPFESILWDNVSNHLQEKGVVISSCTDIQKLSQRHILERGRTVEGMSLAVSQKARLLANRLCPAKDLQQEAMLRLHRATCTFDPRKGNKFSTYIWKGIVREMKRYKALQTPFGMSNHTKQQILDMNILLSSEDLPVDAFDQVKYLAKKMGAGRKRIEELLPWCFRKLGFIESLDNEIPNEEEVDEENDWNDGWRTIDEKNEEGEDEEGEEDEEESDLSDKRPTLATIVPDQHIETSDQSFRSVMLQESISTVLKTITLQERTVLIARFGLNDEILQTLEQVGSTLGVTRERIRQHESAALRKLQHHTRSRFLQEFAISHNHEDEEV